MGVCRKRRISSLCYRAREVVMRRRPQERSTKNRDQALSESKGQQAERALDVERCGRAYERGNCWGGVAIKPRISTDSSPVGCLSGYSFCCPGTASAVRIQLLLSGYSFCRSKLHFQSVLGEDTSAYLECSCSDSLSGRRGRRSIMAEFRAV